MHKQVNRIVPNAGNDSVFMKGSDCALQSQTT